MLKTERMDRVRAALRAQGLTQMIVCDPKSVWYLTGVAVEPYERLLALYLPWQRKLARVKRINVAPLAVHIREQQRVALTDRDHAAARDCAFCFGQRLLIAAVRRRRAGRLPRAAREQGAEQRQDE